MANYSKALKAGQKMSSKPSVMDGKFQDGMAICAEYGKPDLFLTFTCNTSWPEIQRELKPGEKAQNQPVLVARVFYLYVKQLMKDILVGQIFGKIDAYLWVIEFQKRGLPHLHLLIILANHDRLITADFVDSLISAEIPPDPAECEDQNQKKARQDLQDIVLSNMVHGPCGKDYPFKPCMENNECTKKFPKPFTKETFVDPNSSYATYKRRSPEDGGRSIDIQGTKLDNRWIVPYCPFLSLRYDCHINLECCASTKSVKYLTKYIHKGNDRAMIRTEVEGATRDEISEYEDLRSVGSVEAAWHLLNYPIHKQFPAVMPLRVHLKDQQEIYFDENQEGEALERQQQTELTAWFEFNKKALAEGAKPGTLPRYVDMPKEHVFDKKLKIWKKRRRMEEEADEIVFPSKRRVIGRLHSINPAAGEVYYLRILLYHVTGITSFNDLLILPSGKKCETYKQVCAEMGLLNDDREWSNVLEEASLTKMCYSIRELYIAILMFCQPTDPLHLFNTYWHTWTDDIDYKAEKEGIILTPDQKRTMVLLDLESRLDSFEKKLTDFSLPHPTKEELSAVNVLTHSIPAIIREQLDFDINDLKTRVNANISTFTPEQTKIYEKVMKSVQNNEQFLGFISARGGCGKTYLTNTILASVRSLDGGSVALAHGTTGISSRLLENGRTFHSRFKAPLKATEGDTLRISGQSQLAELLRVTKLILIDEATMLNRFLLEALDRTMRDLMGMDLPFGGKSLLLAGDFRQTLPVCKGEEKTGIIKQALTSSYLWPEFEVLSLCENMRVKASGNKELQRFDRWLLDIGNGKSDSIFIPGNMVATLIKPKLEDKAMTEFCRKIFPKLEENFNDPDYLNGRVILAPTNNEVAMLNSRVLKMLPGEVETFRSGDELAASEDLLRFNMEFLNSLQPNGFPPFELQLKPGMPLMLLRNLNPMQGLCNGTKMFYIRSLDNKVLQCRLEGSERIVLIPRILFIPQSSDFPFEWQRRQFPVMPAFAMSINRSQGQTLSFVGLWLKAQCFTHGQLYVGCSRVGSPDNIKFAIKEEGYGKQNATNVVFKEILLPD